MKGLTADVKIRFVKLVQAAFYRPDFPKFLTCLLTIRPGQVFVPKDVIKPFKHSIRLSKRSTDPCLCYNKAYSIPIGHGYECPINTYCKRSQTYKFGQLNQKNQLIANYYLRQHANFEKHVAYRKPTSMNNSLTGLAAFLFICLLFRLLIF